MKFVLSKYFDGVQCKTEDQQEYVKSYDEVLDRVVRSCRSIIGDGKKDYSSFVRKAEDFGGIKCHIGIEEDKPTIAFMYSNVFILKFFVNYTNVIDYRCISLVSDRMTYSCTYDEVKTFMESRDDITRLLQYFADCVDCCNVEIVMSRVESRFFGTVLCEDEEEIKEVKSYDSMITGFISVCSQTINKGKKDVPVNLKENWSDGVFVFVVKDIPHISFCIEKKVTIDFYYDGKLKYNVKSENIKDTEGNTELYYINVDEFIRDTVLQNCLREFCELLNKYTVKINSVKDGLCEKSDVCGTFINVYKNTGKTLGQAINTMISSGYTKSEVLKAVITVLNDVKWED